MTRRRNVHRATSNADVVEADLAARVCTALKKRIGPDRYAVWFGESISIAVEPEGPANHAVVTISVGTGFSHEWLRKTFRGDVDAVIHDLCGPNARLEWQEISGTVSGPERDPESVSGTSSMEDGSKPRRHGRARASQDAARPAPLGTSIEAGGPSPTATRRPPAALEAFVVGTSNRMAYAAVELAAHRPGEMSPLFLHGPSGVGKTHLLEGFCSQARTRHPGITAVLLSAEQFTTGFLQALHGSGLPGFRRSCRHADLLVIDDLQFFVGKKATIVEFQQTIDSLLRQGRQMVFAADRDLDALGELGPDLLVRLKGGMQARILPPDADVRRGIVAGLAARRGLGMPADVVEYIAARITRHARELLGAVNRLEASSHMLGLPITLGMAEEALADLVRSSGRGVRLADIERAVCTAFGIESGSLQSSRRSRSVNHPRMLAMFLARKHTSSVLTEIGSYFGRRSHSTVTAAHKAVVDWVSRHESVRLADASWDAEEAIRRVEDLLRVG
ncbi:MAG: DnaA ATPase domain-containing protein [Planctomycetia bacterium]